MNFPFLKHLWRMIRRRHFDLRDAGLDRKQKSDVCSINSTIERLAALRETKIEVTGPLMQSKIAWKIATFQEAILYRVVMLARGARSSWNDRNLTLCFLATRALVETIALFDDFEFHLAKELNNEDLEAIDKLVMNRAFSTKDEILLKERPEIGADTVLKFIDRMEKRYGLPIRNNYDNLSERCHPNAAGHHFMYSTTDYSDGSVRFSESQKLDMNFAFVCAPIGLISLFEESFHRVKEGVLKVAAVQHRDDPVRHRQAEPTRK